MRLKRQLLIALACVMVAALLWPASAHAQRGRARRGGGGRPVVVTRGFYGYPYFGGFYSPFYDPFYGPYFTYPWVSPFFMPPFGLMQGGYMAPSGVRLQVLPRQTEVRSASTLARKWGSLM